MEGTVRQYIAEHQQELLELTLQACPGAELIPAHIWTPHFSLFGAYSGFDTIEEYCNKLIKIYE